VVINRPTPTNDAAKPAASAIGPKTMSSNRTAENKR